jgi:hypothetical protein
MELMDISIIIGCLSAIIGIIYLIIKTDLVTTILLLCGIITFIAYLIPDEKANNTIEFSNVSTNVATPLLNNNKNPELSGQVVEKDNKLIIKWDKKDGYDHHGDGVVDIIKKEGNKYTVKNDKGTAIMIKSSDGWTIEKEGVYLKLRK